MRNALLIFLALLLAAFSAAAPQPAFYLTSDSTLAQKLPEKSETWKIDNLKKIGGNSPIISAPID
jgi:hypothetical protein